MNKSIIPNLFTSANLAFGVLGITLSATNNTFCAAICILLSLVADGLDGRVARALGVAGPMGRELDSLSDVGECSYSIIMATEIIGLSHMEREIVANVVKYNHRIVNTQSCGYLPLQNKSASTRSKGQKRFRSIYLYIVFEVF